MISRRLFLAGTASSALLVACGADDRDTTTTTSPPQATNEGEPQLGTGFASGLRGSPPVLAAGLAQRAPLVVFDEVGRVWSDDLPDSFEVELRRDGQRLATSVVHRHQDGIPVPYYPLELNVDAPGDYEAHSSISATPAAFRVGARDEVGLVQVGDPLRPVTTPTFDDARGVDPICTRHEPCPFHEIPLDEAMGTGRPLLFIIATPGFCQTAICGPVLELVIETADRHPDLAVVHAEVYRNPQEVSSGLPDTSEAVDTYGLSFEPSMMVADAGGTVTARLDFTWDRAELEATLQAAAA